ncbi:MAG: YqgE/AlgH family protein [Gammaproteobacteria bacterium]|nr:MAG: YqgE/AlgH family protein [Gammaproteobacteria bacterium]
MNNGSSDDFPSLTNQFLIAMPGMGDPRFQHTVTYICEHNEQGAMGIIINHPLDLKLLDLLQDSEVKQIEIPPDVDVNQPIFLGGPVQQDRGFVVHDASGKWESTLAVTDQICVTTSRDIIRAILQGKGPKRTLIAIGYAGWGPNQLEEEIMHNSWLTVPADQKILFEMDSSRRWQAAAEASGVDITHLTAPAGHA